ncbi:MAG: hypothetical protein U0163_05630 [Gemmatimonadaceae bacterium]
MKRLLVSAILVFWTAACATETPSPLIGISDLGVQAPSSIDAATLRTTGFQATLRNGGARSLYTKIGDAFNGAIEQDPLYTSLGSDAEVEVQRSTGVWSSITVGLLTEGTRFVELKPGKSYRLMATGDPTTFRGQARVRVRYSENADGSGQQSVAYSNTFEIR